MCQLSPSNSVKVEETTMFICVFNNDGLTLIDSRFILIKADFTLICPLVDTHTFSPVLDEKGQPSSEYVKLHHVRLRLVEYESSNQLDLGCVILITSK